MNMNMMDYKTFANTINDAVFVMSVQSKGQFRYEFVNQECMSRFQFTEDIIGKTVDDVVDQTTAKKLNKEYQKISLSGQTVVFTELSHTFIDETKLSPVKNEKGDVTMIIAVTRDITDLEEQRQALIKSNQRYQSLFEYNKAGIFELDRHGHFTALNPAGEELLGKPVTAMRGYTFHSIVCMEDLPVVMQMFQMALDGKTVDYKAAIIDLHGGRKKVDITNVPMIVDDEIVGIYGIARDITTEQKQLETIEYLSSRDPLTTLPNRRSMKDRLTKRLKEAKSINQSFAVIVMDVDDFKLINDSIGHEKGDVLIREVAWRLNGVLPEGYDAGRVGGDEFMVVSSFVEQEELCILLEICRTVFSRPFMIEGRSFHLDASIGVSEISRVNDVSSVEDVMKQAEMAMYASKQKGKGQMSFYDQSMNDTSRRKLFLEQELRLALKNKQLQVYYQPILESGTNKVKSFEALLRWQHADVGWISPEEFIPVAEATGLIHKVGFFVLEESLAQLAAWRNQGAEEIRMSINISVKQLQGQALPRLIKERLNQNRLMPQDIELEVTESVVMEDFDKFRFTLDLLRDLGVYLSIDDFGTGYSSMSSLSKLPFHTLKIDRSFIGDLVYAGKSRAVLRSMIQLSREMGLTTIAEGVESEGQYLILKEEGVNEVQGFYFTKPVPAEEIEAVWLTNVHFKSR